jgi:hypothetical protein
VSGANHGRAGSIDGENVAIEYRWADNERPPQQAEGNQAAQHGASLASPIDWPQLGQRRMGLIRREIFYIDS